MTTTEGRIFINAEGMNFPVLNNRDLDDLRRPEESLTVGEVYDRAFGAALFHKFTEVQSVSGSPKRIGTERLLGMTLLFHPEKGVLAAESWKSYTDSGSFHYGKITYYPTQEECKEVMDILGVQMGERQEINSYLKKAQRN